MMSVLAFVQDVGWEIILTSVVVSLSVFWYVRNQWMPIVANLPPGPPRVPFPFSLIALALTYNKGLQPIQDLRKRYGDMVFVHLGDRPILFISSFDLVKEILVKRSDVTSGRRPVPLLAEVVPYEKGGILFAQGEVWQEHRRFTFQALRTMGMGKRTLENKISEETEYLLDEFSQHAGRPFYPRTAMYTAISNIMCSIVLGHRFEYSDARLQQVMSRIEAVTSDEVGFIVTIPPVFLGKTRRDLLEIKRFIDDEVAAHEMPMSANANEGDHRDIIDMFLAEIARANVNGNKSVLKKEHFWAVVFDLFVAGTETTTTTLTWVMLFIAADEQIKSKVVEEVDRVIGPGRKPCYEDRKRMPYTQAFLLEVFRFHPIVGVGVPHLATADFSARGYHVPKGTEVIMNMLAIHRDPKVWADPEVFRPERFLSQDGKSVLHRPELLPFGAARRICIGEQLAKMELFLFLTNLVQRFSFRLPDGVQPDYGLGTTLQVVSPKRYELICSER